MSNTNYNNKTEIDKPHFYKITNLINKKYYYGVHNGKNTEKYMGSGKVLHEAYEKYGIQNFIKTIISEFDTETEAYAYEAFIVNEKVINDPMCYNLKTGGFGGTTPCEEVRKKISQKNKETWENKTEEEKALFSEKFRGENHPLFGKTHNEEAKAKMRAAKSGENNPNWGKTLSEETKAKLSEKASQRTGEKSPLFGKTLSEETKAKMRKPKSAEHKAKMSEAKKGKNHPMFGKTHDEEALQRMSEARKKENKPIGTCPHCGKTANMTSSFKQWHFNNCKLNPNK